MVTLPFTEHNDGNHRLRTFKADVPDEELMWHWDEEDRYVKVVSGDNWKMQYDDQLPIPLIQDEIYFIAQGVWHRILRGTTDLIVSIAKQK
jgi:hypothetical protein